MRAARVPVTIAVTATGVHYVATAVNSCVSCQTFQQHQARRTAAATTAPFRFTSLLPEDWSALLCTCRRLTHPAASFNFSSPGDTTGHSQPGPPASSFGAPQEEAAAVVQNHAYMHIVERTEHDFVPNNMIYHQLQKFHLLPHTGSSTEHASDSSSMWAFTNLVVGLQQQPPQAPRAITADLLNAEDSAQASRSEEKKRLLDPLATNTDAAAKSLTNVEQLRAYTAATSSASSSASSSTSPHIFHFFPYPISAAVSIPYCSEHFCVLVNLKPIVPFHLMVVPIRCVGTIHGLIPAEVEDWGRVMRCTIDVLEDLRRQQQQEQSQQTLGNYSIAVQQGALAGQTVAHLHVHVIPFDPLGKLAGEPETDEEEQRRRPPRTAAVMRAETDLLRPLFAKHAAASTT